jgi:hypothetical protein
MREMAATYPFDLTQMMDICCQNDVSVIVILLFMFKNPSVTEG